MSCAPASTIRRSFLDDRTTLRASARPALAFLPSGSFVGINVDAELSLERVDLFSPFWTGMAAVDYSLTEVDAFSYTGPGVRPLVRSTLVERSSRRRRRGGVRYLAFLRIEPGAQAIAAAIGLQDPLATVSLTPSIAYDSHDDRESPRKGGYARLGFEVEYHRSTPGIHQGHPGAALLHPHHLGPPGGCGPPSRGSDRCGSGPPTGDRAFHQRGRGDGGSGAAACHPRSSARPASWCRWEVKR